MSRHEENLIIGYAKMAEQYKELHEAATDEDTRILCTALAGVASDAAMDLSKRLAKGFDLG